MRKNISFILFLLISALVHSQKVYFVYLQTENQQPFYIRMGEKVTYSSSSGYLVLPQLRDSTYDLKIGGVDLQQSNEQLFSITVKTKDQGFLLKNFVEKGWGLFNLQNFEVLMNQSNSTKIPVSVAKKEANSFTDLLSKAADDSTLNEKVVNNKKENTNGISENKELKTKDSDNLKVDKLQKNSSSIDSKENSKSGKIIEKDTTDLISSNIEVKEIYKRTIVKKIAESSTTEGYGLTFLDISENGSADTICILIPENKKVILAQPEVKKEDKKFLEIISEDTTQHKISSENNDKSIELKLKSDSLTTQQNKTINCPGAMEEDEMSNLKIKMSLEKTNEAMIGEASKTFSIKCFTTAQVKFLSTLFSSDEGKYKFFDAVYSHILDIANFNSLQNELKDEYFIKRFKAMIY